MKQDRKQYGGGALLCSEVKKGVADKVTEPETQGAEESGGIWGLDRLAVGKALKSRQCLVSLGNRKAL